MTTLTISIIVVFVLGYALIATESLTKVNKAAIALLMLVGCWTLYMMDPMQYLQLMHPDYTGGAAGMVEKVTGIIQEHLGDTATTLFFLMGAMTIVEIVDQNGGFNWVRKVMKTKSKRALLWRIAFLTFFLSAILDNLTTSIVMIMILRKLVTDHKDRMVYASLVHHRSQFGWCFLSNRRRYHHHALEQGIDYCCRHYCRNLHPVCSFHGDSSPHPSDHVEGRTRDA